MPSRQHLRALLASAAVAFAVLTSACATVKPMPFSQDARTRLPAGKAIFLMTLTQRNTFKSSYQPKLFVAHVERSVVNGSEDRLNFKIDERGKTETESPETGNNYLVRLQLEDGDYVIRGFTSLNHSLFIHASFFAPLHAP
ncbi:MAG: hypothetical protein JWM82_2531, partial [Myxococcales bacterium]|nr:hypothetical protein [Myxococcales bacterium]